MEKALSFNRPKAEPWDELPDIYIDYTVVERTKNLAFVPYGGAWADLGVWQVVWRDDGSDDNAVVTTGPATALGYEATPLHATSDAQQLVGIGLTDLVAVATSDAVLVAHRDCAFGVKDSVAELKAQGVSQATALLRDYRPLGWYENGHVFWSNLSWCIPARHPKPAPAEKPTRYC